MADGRTFSILQWNARGLKAHLNELLNYISQPQNDPDLLCIQETHLKQSQNISIPGYTVIRLDRVDKLGGGIATFIRNGIPYTNLNIKTNLDLQAIRLKLINGYLNVLNIYVPPDRSYEEQDLDPLFQLGHKAILLGDLNAKSRFWGSPVSNPRGEVIEKLLEKHCFVVLNDGQPTYTHYNGTQSHLDITLASQNLGNKASFTVINNTLGSDHNPVLTKYFENELFVDDTPLPRPNLRKADWVKFKEKCREIIPSKINTDNIEVFYATLVDGLTEAANVSVPRKNVTIPRNKTNSRCPFTSSSSKSSQSRHKPRSLPYWNDEIKAAIKARNIARNKMVKRKTEETISKYRELKGKAQHVIKSAARSHWENYCSTLNSSSKITEVWKMAKKMDGQKTSHNIPIITDNNVNYNTNNEKAEHFARTFAAISSDQNYSPEFQKRKEEVEGSLTTDTVNPHIENDDLKDINQDLTLNELRRAIRGAKAQKSPGEDGIPYEYLQRLPTSANKILLKFYNQIWHTGFLPQGWKHSIVIPVPKGGKDPHTVKSYRPVSLTSTLCKIMERLVTDRLSYYLEKNNILNKFQSGFRKGRATIDHIARLHDTILKQNRFRGYTLAVFVDFKSAFDMVWRKGLLLKLQKYGIMGKMYSFIQNFLTDRTIQVRVGNELSNKFNLQNGTAQGSIISPLLFSIMINDLPDKLVGVESSLFADDSCIFKSGNNLDSITRKVDENLQKLVKWCDEWGFNISVEKTVAVLFTERQENSLPKDLTTKNLKVKLENSAKFLAKN